MSKITRKSAIIHIFPNSSQTRMKNYYKIVNIKNKYALLEAYKCLNGTNKNMNDIKMYWSRIIQMYIPPYKGKENPKIMKNCKKYIKSIICKINSIYNYLSSISVRRICNSVSSDRGFNRFFYRLQPVHLYMLLLFSRLQKVVQLI